MLNLYVNLYFNILIEILLALASSNNFVLNFIHLYIIEKKHEFAFTMKSGYGNKIHYRLTFNGKI